MTAPTMPTRRFTSPRVRAAWTSRAGVAHRSSPQSAGSEWNPMSDIFDTIALGDCLDLLRALPANSVDAVLTDPPYGLGKRQPSGLELQRYCSGERLDTGGDFRGLHWEIPPVGVWRECFRVLRPGGHLAAFAGTRTWDIMAGGLRAANLCRARASLSSSEVRCCSGLMAKDSQSQSTSLEHSRRERCATPRTRIGSSASPAAFEGTELR